MSGGWVYIMTNRPNGVLYTGVTSDIGRRAYEHREGLVAGFTKRYGLEATRLHGVSRANRRRDPARNRTSSIGLAPGRPDLILEANPGLDWTSMRR